MPIKQSERKYIIQETTHSDGSITILFRSNTPFSVKKRIVDRFNKENRHATLYSDNRIESSLPEGIRDMERGR